MVARVRCIISYSSISQSWRFLLTTIFQVPKLFSVASKTEESLFLAMAKIRGNLSLKLAESHQISFQNLTLLPFPTIHLEQFKMVELSFIIFFQRLGPYLLFIMLVISWGLPLNHLQSMICFHKLLSSCQNLQIHFPIRALFKLRRDLISKPPSLKGCLTSVQLTRWNFLLFSPPLHKKLHCISPSFFATLEGILSTDRWYMRRLESVLLIRANLPPFERNFFFQVAHLLWNKSTGESQFLQSLCLAPSGTPR